MIITTIISVPRKNRSGEPGEATLRRKALRACHRNRMLRGDIAGVMSPRDSSYVWRDPNFFFMLSITACTSGGTSEPATWRLTSSIICL